MGKGYFRISELADEVNRKYDEGISKGEDVGFKCLQDKYSVKPSEIISPSSEFGTIYVPK